MTLAIVFRWIFSGALAAISTLHLLQFPMAIVTLWMRRKQKTARGISFVWIFGSVAGGIAIASVDLTRFGGHQPD